MIGFWSSFPRDVKTKFVESMRRQKCRGNSRETKDTTPWPSRRFVRSKTAS